MFAVLAAATVSVVCLLARAVATQEDARLVLPSQSAPVLVSNAQTGVQFAVHLLSPLAFPACLPISSPITQYVSNAQLAVFPALPTLPVPTAILLTLLAMAAAFLKFPSLVPPPQPQDVRAVQPVSN